MAARKNQVTKKQLQDMLTSLVKKARDTGEYENFCEEGREAIQAAEKLLGMEVPYEEAVNISVRVYAGFTVGGDGNAMNTDNYTVIVKNANGEELDCYISDIEDADF